MRPRKDSAHKAAEALCAAWNDDYVLVPRYLLLAAGEVLDAAADEPDFNTFELRFEHARALDRLLSASGTGRSYSESGFIPVRALAQAVRDSSRYHDGTLWDGGG